MESCALTARYAALTSRANPNLGRSRSPTMFNFSTNRNLVHLNGLKQMVVRYSRRLANVGILNKSSNSS
ncbi:hypothetical protein GBAR_LOCUS14379 [Geodia barretti]|uniref:Uncharacterized protein n=1 Tax=Geodia barretti TaxID=519541 RepID=A0AA35S9Q4_GEOBA|nr:hypothetical protein GBAR_LOCUS14379 [Geodia barretti]